jgi:hypothetical protein
VKPRLRRRAAAATIGAALLALATQVFTPARAPVGGGTGEFSPQTVYNGRPMALEMGTVPVAWTSRHENHSNVVPVHTKGGFYIAVTLGAKAAEIAENPQIGVVLRVAVLGDELAGPQHDAPVLAKKADKKGVSAARADSEASAGAGWSGTVTAVAAGGVVILIAGLVLVLVRRKRRPRHQHGGRQRQECQQRLRPVPAQPRARARPGQVERVLRRQAEVSRAGSAAAGGVREPVRLRQHHQRYAVRRLVLPVGHPQPGDR